MDWSLQVSLSGFTSASSSGICLYREGLKQVPAYCRCLSTFPPMGQGALESWDMEKLRCTNDAEEQLHLCTEKKARL